MKQYSRKQITEAIAHWKNVLKKMNESNDSDQYGYSIFSFDPATGANPHYLIETDEAGFKCLYFGPIDTMIEKSIERRVRNANITDEERINQIRSSYEDFKKFLRNARAGNTFKHIVDGDKLTEKVVYVCTDFDAIDVAVSNEATEI